jgi:group I intron endonuclease
MRTIDVIGKYQTPQAVAQPDRAATELVVVHHAAQLPRVTGVYAIRCVANRKLYIGSAMNIAKRCRQHVSDLNAQRHRNIHLQRAWNLYGPEAFEFGVVELTDAGNLRDREQYHLDQCQAYDSRFGFNIAPGVDNKIVAPETGRKIAEKKRGHVVTPETRAKLRAARLRQPDPNKGRKRSPEHIERVRAKLKGRKLPEWHRQIVLANTARTPEREAARIAAIVKPYIVTAPDGTTYHVTNLSAFCREHGLGSGLQKVANGKRRQYRGWTCRHGNR